MKRKSIILFLFLLSGCIGADAVDDEITTLSINIENASTTNDAVAALPGGQYSFTASATNDRGSTYQPQVIWNSSNATVATIDENGQLQAVGPGQTTITATARSIQSNAIVVSVVEDENAVALIEISGPTSMLDVGETIQLSAQALNTAGDPVPGAQITWESENTEVAAVNATGEVTGRGKGRTNIRAGAAGKFQTYAVGVGQSSARSGTFESRNGYQTSGSVTLQFNDDDNLVVALGSDFEASNGPGLFVYLSNKSNSISGGLELGKLRSNRGADQYAVPNRVTLDQFDHVLIYCKPFGATFGTAALGGGS